MTASQLKYSSDEWREVFDRAPFWCFWLGADLCGRTVVGGFAPSRDGVGRAFPITVFAFAEETQFFPPPVINMQSRWFQQVGEFVNSTRAETDWEGALATQLNDLPMPTTIRPDSEMFVQKTSGNCFRISTDHGSMAELLQGIGTRDSQSTYARRSIWWTHPGEGQRAQVLLVDQLPDPRLFGGFLTGNFTGEVSLPNDFEGWDS